MTETCRQMLHVLHVHSLSHDVLDLSNWDEVVALLSVTRVRISHVA